MANALAHDQQAATQDSTSTGTQARYNNWVLARQEAPICCNQLNSKLGNTEATLEVGYILEFLPVTTQS